MKIDILGAGISGLSAAYYLAKHTKDHQIRIWEKDDCVGGLAKNFKIENITVERYYHHLFKKDNDLLDLISDLGCENNIKWANSITSVYINGEFYKLSSPIDLLLFKPLSFKNRVLMGYMLTKAKKYNNWKELDKFSAKEFIISISNEEIYKVVWKSLFEKKFGNDGNNVSAAWIWSKLVDRGGSRDIKGREVLGYIDQGLGLIFEKIKNLLEQQGHQVNLQSKVRKINVKQNKVIDLDINNHKINTDLVVSALQTPQLKEILPDEAKNYKQKLSQIDYLANITLVLVLKRNLSNYYWININDNNIPFVGIIEHTNLVNYGNNFKLSIVYVTAYVNKKDERLQYTADEVKNYYIKYLKRLFPGFSEEDIKDYYFWRDYCAQPIVSKNYFSKIPDYKGPFNNFYLTSMARIFPNDRQVSNGISQAKKIVEEIVSTENI